MAYGKTKYPYYMSHILQKDSKLNEIKLHDK